MSTKASIIDMKWHCSIAIRAFITPHVLHSISHPASNPVSCSSTFPCFCITSAWTQPPSRRPPPWQSQLSLRRYAQSYKRYRMCTAHIELTSSTPRAGASVIGSHEGWSFRPRLSRRRGRARHRRVGGSACGSLRGCTVTRRVNKGTYKIQGEGRTVRGSQSTQFADMSVA